MALSVARLITATHFEFLLAVAAANFTESPGSGRSSRLYVAVSFSGTSNTVFALRFPGHVA